MFILKISILLLLLIFCVFMAGFSWPCQHCGYSNDTSYAYISTMGLYLTYSGILIILDLVQHFRSKKHEE